MPGGRFSQLSIGKKLALAFSVILLLLIGSLSASLVYLSRVNSYVDRHQRITIPGVVTASEMLRNVGDMQTLLHHALEHRTGAEQTGTLQAVADIERRTLVALDTYQAAHAARTHPVLFDMLHRHGRADLAEQEGQRIVAIADGISALRSQREDFGRPVRPDTDAEAAYEQTAARTIDAISDLIEIHRKIDVEMKIEGDRLVDQARLLVVSVITLLGLFIVSVYLMMKRLVAIPLKRLASTADRVAHHDLTAQFSPWPSRDEVGTLSDSLAAMLASLRERGASLMRKTKELEAFTYSVAHDLKGPLREIEGFSSLLEKQFADTADPQVRHHIDVIRRSALRLTHMIDALLKYSRLEQQDLPKQRFNIIEMIGSLIVDRFGSMQGPKPSLHVDLPFSDLYGEPVSIRQAIANLLDNAVKFARAGVAPDIRIGGKQTPGAHLIWIRDNGIGFEPAQKDKIFGLFDRLHTPQEYEGTGVGLAIVKMVMEKHGGRVWAESGQGAGSTFYLEFPSSPHVVNAALQTDASG